MIGINFDGDRATFIRYNAELVNISFDMLVESLPPKDAIEEGFAARLYKDAENNLYWEYEELPATVEQRILDLEYAVAALLGGGEGA